MMASSNALEISKTIQTGAFNGASSSIHDINSKSSATTQQSVDVEFTDLKSDPIDNSNSLIPLDPLCSDNEACSPLPSNSQSHRQHKIWPPLPDLRFEQSYLNSISGAETVWGVAIITFRDQVILPLLQGSLWSLLLLGRAHWIQTTRNSGSSVGIPLRSWWYKTKKWKLPEKIRDLGGNAELASSVGDVSARWNGGELWSFAD